MIRTIRHFPKFLLVGLFLAVACPPPSAARDTSAIPEGRHVLVLLSGDYNIPWYMGAADAIQNTFEAAPAGDQITLHTEFAGLDNRFDPGYLLELRDLYRRKYAGLNIHLIIATSDLVVEFLLEHGDELFPGAPVVFIVEEEKLESIRPRANMTGIVGTVRIRDTLDLALGLHPEARRVALVSGAGDFDRVYEAKIRQALRTHPKAPEVGHSRRFPSRRRHRPVPGIFVPGAAQMENRRLHGGTRGAGALRSLVSNPKLPPAIAGTAGNPAPAGGDGG